MEEQTDDTKDWIKALLQFNVSDIVEPDNNAYQNEYSGMDINPYLQNEIVNIKTQPTDIIPSLKLEETNLKLNKTSNNVNIVVISDSDSESELQDFGRRSGTVDAPNNQASNSKKHKKSETDMFRCDLCPKIFNTLKAILVHQREDHSNQESRTDNINKEAEGNTVSKEKIDGGGENEHTEEIKGTEVYSMPTLTKYHIYQGEYVKEKTDIKLNETESDGIPNLTKDKTDHHAYTDEEMKENNQDENVEGISGRTEKEAERNTIQKRQKYKQRQCEWCGMSFKNSKRLLTHEFKKHPEDYHRRKNQSHARETTNKLITLNDNVPDEINNVTQKLLDHSCSKEGKESFLCSICNKNMKTKHTLKAHMKIHVSVRNFECDFCSRRFRQKSVMMCHRSIHLGIKPYKCYKCKSTFRLKSFLLIHQQKNGPFKCKHCCSNYVNLGALKRHVRHACQMQPEKKKKVIKPSLKRHGSNGESADLANHHSSSSKHQSHPSTTVVTVKKTASNTESRASSKDSSPISTYDESDINQLKINITKIIENQATNTFSNKVRNKYKCEQCQLHFRDNMKLSLHLISNGPFKCSKCCSTFENKHGLRRHVNVIHNNLYRYKIKSKPLKATALNLKCKLCMKTFRKKCSLDLHMRTHIGNLPFHCQDCGYWFHRADYRQIHQVKAQRNEIKKCTMCCETFKNDRLLKMHMRNPLSHQKKSKSSEKLQKRGKTGNRKKSQIRKNIKKDQITQNNKYACLRCSDSFDNLTELLDHKATNHRRGRPRKYQNKTKNITMRTNENKVEPKDKTEVKNDSVSCEDDTTKSVPDMKSCEICMKSFNFFIGPSEVAPKICDPCSSLFVEFVKSRRTSLT